VWRTTEGGEGGRETNKFKRARLRYYRSLKLVCLFVCVNVGIKFILFPLFSLSEIDASNLTLDTCSLEILILGRIYSRFGGTFPGGRDVISRDLVVKIDA